MAAMASLRYFLLIRFSSPQNRRASAVPQAASPSTPKLLRGLLELFFFIVADVRTLAFGEPVHEECLASASEEEDGPVAFRPSLPRPRDPLFDDLTARSASIWPFSARPTDSCKTASGYLLSWQ